MLLHRGVGRSRVTTLTVLAFTVLLSCSKEAPKGSQAQNQGQTAAQNKPASGQPAQQPPAPASPSAQAIAAPAQPAAGTASKPVVPAPVKIDTGIQALFAFDRDTELLPEDFSIGPLSDQAALEGKDKAAITAARSFLSSLTEASVDSKLLSPDSTPQLKDSLSYHMKKGDVPSTYRIGRPKELSSGEIAFNVRLFHGEGTAEGEIYLSENDKAWRVSDFQLNLAELSEIREKKEEKFIPSSYRWLLGE
jgi:hypothetical protein